MWGRISGNNYILTTMTALEDVIKSINNLSIDVTSFSDRLGMAEQAVNHHDNKIDTINDRIHQIVSACGATEELNKSGASTPLSKHPLDSTC